MNRVFTVAEIAQAHDGSLGIAHSFIDALKDTGVDAVKFQVHIAEAESSIYEQFRVNFSYEDKSRFDYWKRMEFPEEQWQGLKDHCEQNGMEFIASPFSNKAVDMLKRLNVFRYKVGSGETSNLLMLEKIAATGKPVILSTGMSSWDELDAAAELLRHYNNKFTVLQCTTAYPTNPEQWGLNVIKEIKERYNVPAGFSDHSGDVYACLAAASWGADLLEFHVTFDKKMFGPDATSSLTIDQVKMLIKGVRQIETACNNPVIKADTEKFEPLKKMFEKSLAVNRDVRAGEKITTDILEAKKPKGHGVSASDYRSLIGKTFKHNLEKWSFIKPGDVNE
jgi:N,N'-diacetyllegionaminate synthase